MEQRDIQELLSHPERLDATTLIHLRELVARYPYFQTAWVLYLKNLFLLSDPNFKEELRRGALFVADLSVLFYYIEGERFLIKKHNVDTEAGVSSGSDRTLDLIDRFLSELPEQGQPSHTVSDAVIPVEMPGDYTSVLLSEVTDEEKEASPLHGQELIDHFIEQAEALAEAGKPTTINDTEPIETPTGEENAAEEEEVAEATTAGAGTTATAADEATTEAEATAEATTEAAAEATAATAATTEATATAEAATATKAAAEATAETKAVAAGTTATAGSTTEATSEGAVEAPSAEGPVESPSEEEPSEETYFTETLAKIYVRQQRYDKALEIIKKLNLKYPKKNAYFADQIRFLEKLIINAKSK